MSKKTIIPPNKPKAGKKPPGKTYLSVYLDEMLKCRLIEVAKKRDLSASKLVKLLIYEAIDDHDQLGDFLTDPHVKSGLRFLLKHPDALNALIAASETESTQENLNSLFRNGEAV